MPLKRIQHYYDQRKRQADAFKTASSKAASFTFNTAVFTPKPTGQNWLGIYNATKGLFGELLFELEHHYSQPILSDVQMVELFSILKKNGVKQLIFSGTHIHFLELCKLAKKDSFLTAIIFHGALSELNEDNLRASLMAELIQLAKSGIIDKVGFIKKDLAQVFSSLAGIHSFQLGLVTNINAKKKLENSHDLQYRIAIPAGNNFNKNFFNQLTAAALSGADEIHVWGHSRQIDLWKLGEKIIHHHPMQHTKFLEIISTCNLVLYLSFSESWGQVITESAALGVPCLCSNNNAIFDENEELKNLLVLTANENPTYIAQKIHHIRKLDQDKLSLTLQQHIEQLNSTSVKLKDNFIRIL